MGSHFHTACRLDAAMTDKGIHFVFLEQECDALHIGVDHFLLVPHHGFQIELGLADCNPHGRKIMTGFFEQIGSMQQCL